MRHFSVALACRFVVQVSVIMSWSRKAAGGGNIIRIQERWSISASVIHVNSRFQGKRLNPIFEYGSPTPTFLNLGMFLHLPLSEFLSAFLMTIWVDCLSLHVKGGLATVKLPELSF